MFTKNGFHDRSHLRAENCSGELCFSFSRQRSAQITICEQTTITKSLVIATTIIIIIIIFMWPSRQILRVRVSPSGFSSVPHTSATFEESSSWCSVFQCGCISGRGGEDVKINTEGQLALQAVRGVQCVCAQYTVHSVLSLSPRKKICTFTPRPIKSFSTCFQFPMNDEAASLKTQWVSEHFGF